jgi:hypothetical protein
MPYPGAFGAPAAPLAPILASGGVPVNAEMRERQAPRLHRLRRPELISPL